MNVMIILNDIVIFNLRKSRNENSNNKITNFMYVLSIRM